jgi:hypothetical protein
VGVYVEHGLPCPTPGVEHDAITRVGDSLIRGDRRDLEQELSGQTGICLRQIDCSRVMFLGDDEHMRGRLWVDITESQGPRPIPDDGGGHIPRDDLAEKAVAIHDPLSLIAIAVRSWLRTLHRVASHGSLPHPAQWPALRATTAYEAGR